MSRHQVTIFGIISNLLPFFSPSAYPEKEILEIFSFFRLLLFLSLDLTSFLPAASNVSPQERSPCFPSPRTRCHRMGGSLLFCLCLTSDFFLFFFSSFSSFSSLSFVFFSFRLFFFFLFLIFLQHGTVHPYAEYNAHADAEALRTALKGFSKTFFFLFFFFFPLVNEIKGEKKITINTNKFN